jgi:hypothetical protein
MQPYSAFKALIKHEMGSDSIIFNFEASGRLYADYIQGLFQ